MNVSKGDRVKWSSEEWRYWTPSHRYNEHKSVPIDEGTVIAISKYGILVKWDNNWVKQEWINFNKLNRNLGYNIPGQTSNSYTRYEISR